MPPSTQQAQTVLITGGAGFIGYHIVQRLLQDPTFTSITVLSRSANKDRSSHISGVHYVSCDITNQDAFAMALVDIEPTVIIHTVSAPPTTASAKDFESVNVGGTKVVVELALQSEHVRALVFTSTSSMYAGREHLNLTEEHPLGDTDPYAMPYAKAKATAEGIVLRANRLPDPGSRSGNVNWSGFLATGALRFPIVYGVREPAESFVSGVLGALERDQTKVMIGEGKTYWSYCSAQNVAESHLLLAKALISSDSSGVAGEAFNINDGEPRVFWSTAKEVWRLAGHNDPKDLSTKIPTWFAVALANVLEFLWWVCTFGTKRPGLMGRQQVEYCCFDHTYSIAKARERLGYMPKVEFEERMRETVQWVQDDRARLKKKSE